MNEDQSLADVTKPAAPQASPLRRDGDTDTAAIAAAAESTVPLTVEQILKLARFPERRAQVCLRADLEARFDELVDQLRPLVNADGTVREDAETSLGVATAKARILELDAQIQAVRAEMAQSMWKPLFRGMSSDDLAVFNKEYWPAKDGAPLTDYYNRLIARCVVEPEMTLAEVQELRKALSHRAFQELIQSASNVNVGMGVDVPKSPISSLAQPAG